MWCLYCDHDVVECECGDIEERLGRLLGGAAEFAAVQNLHRRRVEELLTVAASPDEPAH